MRSYQDEDAKSPQKKKPEQPEFDAAATSKMNKGPVDVSQGGKFRLMIGAGVMVLAVIVLLMIFSNSGQNTHHGEYQPKTLVVNLRFDAPAAKIGDAINSHKAPNLHEIAREGQMLTCAADVTGSMTYNCARTKSVFNDLTGATVDAENDAANPFETAELKSFLAVAKARQLHTTVIGPEDLFSRGNFNSEKKTCTSIGPIDQECYAKECGSASGVSCNTDERIIATSVSETWSASLKSVQESEDITYTTFTIPTGTGSITEIMSGITVVDAAFGQLVEAAVERTGLKHENWLVVVTSSGPDGRGEDEAIFGVAAYSHGTSMKLNKFPKAVQAETTQMAAIIEKWMAPKERSATSEAEDEVEPLLLCSNGRQPVFDCERASDSQ